MPFLSSFLIKTILVIQGRSKVPFLRLPCNQEIIALHIQVMISLTGKE